MAARRRPDPADELARVFGSRGVGSGPPEPALGWARTTLLGADLDPEQDRAAAIRTLRAEKGLTARAAEMLVNELAHGW